MRFFKHVKRRDIQHRSLQINLGKIDQLMAKTLARIIRAAAGRCRRRRMLGEQAAQQRRTVFLGTALQAIHIAAEDQPK